MVQRLIGHQPLQPRVLLLQLLEPLRLIQPQAAVLPPPAGVRLLTHAQPPRATGSPWARTTAASRSLPMICSAVYRVRARPTPSSPAAILAQDLDRFWGRSLCERDYRDPADDDQRAYHQPGCHALAQEQGAQRHADQGRDGEEDRELAGADVLEGEGD